MWYTKEITDRVTERKLAELVKDDVTADLFTVATEYVCDSCLYQDADAGKLCPCSQCDWNED